MYRLSTMYSVTNRQTDDSIMPIADHTAWQFIRLKLINCLMKFRQKLGDVTVLLHILVSFVCLCISRIIKVVRSQTS